MTNIGLYIILFMNSEYIVPSGEVLQFREKGFIKVRSVIGKEELSEFRAVMNETVQRIAQKGDKQSRIDDYSNYFTQVTNIWKVQPATAPFILQPRFASIARQLLGVQHVRLYHDQALVKQSKAQKTPWHQDYFYWPIDSPNTVTMWLPLHDCPRKMGTMKFVKGSFKNDNIQKMPISEHSEKYFESVIQKQSLEVECYDLQVGDATFHYGRTLHCSHPNDSGLRREVITIIFFQDGARAVGKQQMNQFREVDLHVFCPGTKKNSQIMSQLNPLLS